MVHIDRIGKDIEIINTFNATPGEGITRLSFSEAFKGAFHYVIDELKKIGAEVSIVTGGNIRGRLKGTEEGKPAVMVGSHLDSVYHGGRFDGVVGVVSALETVRVIVEENLAHRHPIDVIAFAEEEGSRFGTILMGSRIWAGKLSREELRQIKDKDGLNYLEAMEQIGIVPDDLSILRPEGIKAMLELHIEQSLVLERAGHRIGIVEGIAGIRQLSVTIVGTSNHAGATPMDMRFDALQGAAQIIAAVEEIAIQSSRRNLVATVGSIHCEPGQSNVIPGKVQFTLDIRDREASSIDATVDRITEVIKKTCNIRGLMYSIIQKSVTPPIALSKEIISLIEKLTKKKKLTPFKMFSGALHDSSILAELTNVGMIFVPSKAGRSHCPEEFTDLNDIGLATDILVEAVYELAA
jgi:allantoate deiminase